MRIKVQYLRPVNAGWKDGWMLLLPAFDDKVVVVAQNGDLMGLPLGVVRVHPDVVKAWNENKEVYL